MAFLLARHYINDTFFSPLVFILGCRLLKIFVIYIVFSFCKIHSELRNYDDNVVYHTAWIFASISIFLLSFLPLRFTFPCVCMCMCVCVCGGGGGGGGGGY